MKRKKKFFGKFPVVIVSLNDLIRTKVIHVSFNVLTVFIQVSLIALAYMFREMSFR